ncbi:alpha amylase C-terminal domain-containing protein [Flammeovirga yaeyamensis]|uniref:1,4-alpha-glucan branching enzyme n=1 Tax=Flammeovirga yaeyamensis TaxID=367791 RepID=A0AAX1NCR5_9BACT|nr:alpha-amylase family glycosyl hydrolase [Flammeovirga yaeyamensis]MBB3698771.1 1,4-alpha-glucan branching enzyme [Flammeovirga yaeyamensis]NMF37356.1 1,4-alpha-glucan-branching enzyme [Flammeovirga yaeyamensis]QWG03828.1 alpha amylase C-terminal domain-containing protein [Flammeovirga yaeyamensis]
MSKQLPQLVKDDMWLEPQTEQINARINSYNDLKTNLQNKYGSLQNFASAYKFLGVNYDPVNEGWWYREWAPAAHALYLEGDFNNWNRDSHPLRRIEGSNEWNGVWEIFLSKADYKDTFVHGSFIKVRVVSQAGDHERIPAYIERVVQEEGTPNFVGQLWFSEETNFDWSGDDFKTSSIKAPIIYEAHVGMSQEEEKMGTYNEFTENILPRVKALGYNCIQLMAVQEHPYYGSFGYHVSNFYAATSKFGTPEELKHLIKTAHSMGIAVIMDIVHSHAVKNHNEGINEFDGTVYQYFHSGDRGNHPDWDSKLFDYSKWEVIQFLGSNVKYWLDEYHFDGFRFDGVTSMMYHHHGHAGFGSYDDYFNMGVDVDAVRYLQLANEIAHEVKPDVISIAEDVSGMPGLSRGIQEGGVGFDYRLSMGIPDFWIKVLEEQSDEQWNLWDFWSVMLNKRANEKAIAYSESHDQALVGDKTIAMWLMDAEMYTGMDNESGSMVVDRGVALHKMIRFLTCVLGGEGYLNFMGNEFGHPEWIDFPREGNGWSHQYARRQWSLVENGFLRYQKMNNFDGAMVHLVREHHTLEPNTPVDLLNMDTENKTICFRKGDLVFVFNFSPTNSLPDYKFFVGQEGKYEMILSTDEKQFGGFGRNERGGEYFTDDDKSISIYNTNRSAMVFKIVD